MNLSFPIQWQHTWTFYPYSSSDYQLRSSTKRGQGILGIISKRSCTIWQSLHKWAFHDARSHPWLWFTVIHHIFYPHRANGIPRWEFHQAKHTHAPSQTRSCKWMHPQWPVPWPTSPLLIGVTENRWYRDKAQVIKSAYIHRVAIKVHASQANNGQLKSGILPK